MRTYFARVPSALAPLCLAFVVGLVAGCTTSRDLASEAPALGMLEMFPIAGGVPVRVAVTLDEIAGGTSSNVTVYLDEPAVGAQTVTLKYLSIPDDGSNTDLLSSKPASVIVPDGRFAARVSITALGSSNPGGVVGIVAKVGKDAVATTVKIGAKS